MNIVANIETLNKVLYNYNVKLIVVSKNQPLNLVKEAYNSGCRHFAENTVQNLLKRKEELPTDILWHMIGHLQTNKVKLISSFVHLIHSVDSLKLAKEIDKEAKKNNRIINVLLQINISNEENKYGFQYDELIELLDNKEILQLENIKIIGLMGMASNTNNIELINSQFTLINKYLNKLQENYFYNNSGFKELSIGMSNDYTIAIKNNSTMVRLGSIIFNE